MAARGARQAEMESAAVARYLAERGASTADQWRINAWWALKLYLFEQCAIKLLASRNGRRFYLNDGQPHSLAEVVHLANIEAAARGERPFKLAEVEAGWNACKRRSVATP